MSIAAGSQLGPYQVSALLGAGGMGEVYRAQDSRLGRAVAIKILHADFSADPDRLRRFEQEARAVAALNHPNILAVHDVGSHQGAPYIVSELLEGETLRQRLNAPAMPIRRVVDCVVQVAHGLAAAHEKGVVHRDLKPENIFVTTDGLVKILDFGLAKLVEREPAGSASAMTALSPDTAPGFVLGTVGYMAPEQVRGTPVDHRTDIFAFGTIVYEMLAGRRPFLGDTSADTMTAILKEEPPDLPIAERRIPPALARVVDRCLNKNPAVRFQSAGDLAFALDALSGHSGTSETPVDTTSSRSTRSRLAWIVAAALGVGFVAMLSAAMFGGFRGTPAEDSRTFRFSIAPPEGWTLASGTMQPIGVAIAPIAVSPNGWQVAFVALDGQGKRLIGIRSRDALSPRPLNGTEGAVSPFWSPDGRFLAFFANRKLKKIAVSGGPAVTLSDSAQRDCVNSLLLVCRLATTARRRIRPSRRASDIWLIDVVRGTRMRLTTDSGDDLSPVWSPDGKTIAFASRREGKAGIYQRPSDGSGGDELLFGSETTVLPGSWSPDARFLLYMSVRSAMRPDLWVLPLAGRPRPFAQENGVIELPGAFSPDGHWIAYFSNKTGRMEVYVAPFPGPGGPMMVSTSGGAHPRWRRDGKEIFYVNVPDGRLMSAEVKNTDGTFAVGTVRELFTVRSLGARSPYDVTADGQRFLINVAVTEPEPSVPLPLTVVVNWTTEFKK